MKKVLIIQSRSTKEIIDSEQLGYRRVIGNFVNIDFVSSLDESIDWSRPEDMLNTYNAVIFGGSGDFDFDGGRRHDDVACTISKEIVSRVRNLVLYAIDEDFPMLGICFGHQIVSEVLGVRVIHDQSQRKVGSYQVVLTDEGKKDPLFSFLPERFVAQYMHKDSLSDCPTEAVLLANSDCCRASALRFGSCVYTMQFHPEITAEEVSWKLAQYPGYVPQGIDLGSIIKPSTEASLIIPRFIETIVV